MKKKLISALAAVIAAATICMVSQMPATAYTDNNGNYHAHEYSAILSFANANNYFYTRYGLSEVELTTSIKRGNAVIGYMHYSFNYELIGASYGFERTATWNDGWFMDGFVSSNGTYRYSSTKKRPRDGYSSTTGILSVYGSNSITYLGSVYYEN